MTLWYKLLFIVFLFATAAQLRPANEANSTAVTVTSNANTTTTSSATTAHDDDGDAHTSREVSDDLSQDSNSSDIDTTQSKTTTTALSSTSPSSVSSSLSSASSSSTLPSTSSSSPSSSLLPSSSASSSSPSSSTSSISPPSSSLSSSSLSKITSTSSPPSSVGTSRPLLVQSANIADAPLQLPAPGSPENASYSVATPPSAANTATGSTSSTVASTSTDSSEMSEDSQEATTSDDGDRNGNGTSTTIGPSQEDDEEDDEADDGAKEDDEDEGLAAGQNSTGITPKPPPHSGEKHNSREHDSDEISVKSFWGVDRATDGDQDLVMECNFTSDSLDGIRVTWFRHGMSIFSRSHSRFRITTKKLEKEGILFAQLRITCIFRLDTGPYSCMAFRGPEVAVQDFQLVVYDKAKLRIYPPTLSLSSRHHKVVFWCKVLNPNDALTSTGFQWQVNGVTPNKVFPPVRGVIERNGTIEFHPTGEAGNCTCFVGRSQDTAYFYLISRGMTTCPEEIDKHGLFWPKIPAGKEAIAYCPVHHTGQAMRRCGPDGQWAEPANLLDCVLDSLKDIDTQVQEIVDGTANITVGTVLEGLLTIACNGSECEQLDGAGNLDKTVDILDKVTAIEDADVTQNDAEAFSSVLDTLLDRRKGQDWNRVTQRDKRKPTRLLLSVRRIGRSAGRHLPPNASLPIHKANVDILVSRMSFRDLVFPEYSAGRTSWMFLHADSLENIAENFKYVENSSTTTDLLYTAACYKTIAALLPNYTAEPLMGKGTDDLTINSEVLSLSFGTDQSTISLLRPLVLHFKNTDVNFSRPVCSFWDFNAENNEGAWSNAGCELDEEASSSTDTVCRCHHLTNFAVLMSPYRSSTVDDTALSIITYIGCGLSVLGCLMTLAVYLRLWRYLKSARAHLLMQLCAVLIVFYVIFLIGVERTSNADACRAVALMLHFLLLVAFFVMLALGIEIAITVTYVFSAATRSKLCYLILLAWGLPFAIVCISAGVTQLDGYGGSICWLSLQSGLLYAFVGPALLVIVANTVIMGIVLRAIYSTAVMITKTKREKIKAGVRSICVLLPSMGLTWVFGTLAVNEKTVVFEYIFAVCNCLQGVFIFLFYCLLNSSVREGVQRLRQRHEVSKNVYSDDAKVHKSGKTLLCFRSSKNAEQALSDSDNSSKLSLNLSSSVPGESSDAPNTTNQKLGYPQDSSRYGDNWSKQPPDFPVPASDHSARAPDRTEPGNRHRPCRSVSFDLPRYSDVCGSAQHGGGGARSQRNIPPRQKLTRRRSANDQSD